MRANEFITRRLTEALLVTDVPNEEWLKGQQEYARKKGRNTFGVPYMGETTGYVRQPSQVELPVSLLAQLPGARNEQQNVRQRDLDAIIKIMKDTGQLPMYNGKEYKPFIGVAWNGEPWVLEGNHRIMAAAKLGWKTLPVELKYFDGGERVDSGILAPARIGLNNPKPGTAITMNVNETLVVDDYNPETVKQGFKREKWYRGRYLLQAEARPFDEYEVKPTKGLIVTVFDTKSKSMWFGRAGIARARFIVVGDHMEVSTVQVATEYQRQGIASAMYNFARELGNDVLPSRNQTDMGKSFWSAGAGVGKSTPNEPPGPEPELTPAATTEPAKKPGFFKRLFK